MQSLDDEERKAALGEVLADELKAIKEYVSAIPEMKSNIRNLKQDVRILKSDMRVVKVVIKDISRQQKLDSRRITNLETA